MSGILICMMTAMLFCFGNTSWATDEDSVKQPSQIEEQEQGMMIYGSQLMTPEERTAYHARMRAATSEEERERIREEHHAEMQKRAAEQGLTLPDEPPGQGMGKGMGHGSGMGHGHNY